MTRLNTRFYQDISNLPGVGQYLRRNADTGLRGDIVAIGITALACYAAVAWPTIAYLLLLTAVATNIWRLGALRALAISLGVIALLFAFLIPTSDKSVFVRVFKDVPHVVFFSIVVALVSAATEMLRRARAVAETHVLKLNRLNADLAQQMEEVRALSENLTSANEALEDALKDAERTVARANALQEVTAAMSMASTTADIATALLTRGLHTVQATRGHLVLVEDGRVTQVIGAVGRPDDKELMQLYSSGDDSLPILQAIRDRHSVWLRSVKEYDECFAGLGAALTDADYVGAHLALPLIHADRVVGGVAFEFTFCPDTHATDELFTSLLAQATADALQRARSYDEERAARQAAELMSHAREQVLGVVAHDLRNPLNLVSMTTQLLAEPDLTPERRKSSVAISTRAVQRMNRLIGDLLDIVRLETGHLSLNIRRIDVNRMLKDTFDAFEARASDQGITLALTPAPDGTLVQADEERVLQLLDNLVGNALKFTPSGGRVSIDAYVDDGEWHASVADTGPGIAEEQRSRLFDRFWQARGDDRRGLGLGLAIAKGIAEAHGGRLWVDSTVGEGSAFQFAMPLELTR
ncbi:MAG: ATP-binding protein [Gemmatimonadaceae bacterium]